MGNDIDRKYLAEKVMQAEDLVGRKVSYVVLKPEKADRHFIMIKIAALLSLWNSDEDKLILHYSISAGMK